MICVRFLHGKVVGPLGIFIAEKEKIFRVQCSLFLVGLHEPLGTENLIRFTDANHQFWRSSYFGLAIACNHI